jgi:hypothetical protein
MFIRVSDPTLVNDLRDQLRRAGCIAVQIGLDTLEVAVPDAPTRGQEAREVRAYVRTWTAAEGVEADVVADRVGGGGAVESHPARSFSGNRD